MRAVYPVTADLRKIFLKNPPKTLSRRLLSTAGAAAGMGFSTVTTSRSIM